MPRKYRKKIRSHGELNITNYLIYNNVNFTREYIFNDCRSPKNYPLRFDFYLINLNLLIEFQGQHHFFPINNNPRSKYVHNKTKIHDNIKREYCKSKNIRLLEIPYSEKLNIPNYLNQYFNSIGVTIYGYGSIS
jgi:hypothetical protein